MTSFQITYQELVKNNISDDLLELFLIIQNVNIQDV